jgi:hypothetical protein
MGDLLKFLVESVRNLAARLAPRCFVLVIFGDGSYLVARYSRLEPAREEISIEGNAGRCYLTADLGGLRVYRYVRAAPAAIVPERLGSGMVQ